jgi:hypothetical protein
LYFGDRVVVLNVRFFRMEGVLFIAVGSTWSTHPHASLRYGKLPHARKGGVWLVAPAPARLLTCRRWLIGCLRRGPGLAPYMQQHCPSLARGKRRNRPFLAALARGSRPLGHLMHH